MPFTFSHPAAVLPFFGKRLLLSTSGLIVGSMVPDFEKFLRMDLKGSISDTFAGIFILNLPLSIVLLFLFHEFVRDKLIISLPNSLSQRFAPFLGFNWVKHFKNRWYIVVFSSLIGIVTHLLWDSFTHYDGFIAVYFYDFFFTKIEGISLFNIFQHISSLIGALFVGIYIFRMKKVITPQYLAQRKYLYWGLVFLLGCFVFAIRAHYGFERMEEIIVTLIGSIVWAILIGSILIKKHLVV